MNAIQIQTTGGPEVLQVADLPIPVPGPGQVLIRVEAVGVNFIEIYFRKGQYKATMNTVPVVQGQVAMRVMHDCLAHKFKGFYVETPGNLVTRANVLKVLKNWDLLWPKPSHRY